MESILNGKTILIVDDEPDIVTVVEDEILTHCPDSKIDKALNYHDAAHLLRSRDYDLVILDIMGVRGFDLLGLAVKRDLKVAMLTAHALNAEALQKAFKMDAHAYLPKDKLGELVTFLEDVLENDKKTSWRRIADKLESYYNAVLGPDWKPRDGSWIS